MIIVFVMSIIISIISIALWFRAEYRICTLKEIIDHFKIEVGTYIVYYYEKGAEVLTEYEIWADSKSKAEESFCKLTGTSSLRIHDIRLKN